ncbi:MAG: adenylate kinase [Bacteroidaceae bacterium]|jgi:adenylate kinase|nr:adenylate kinase [Bacteroidaceae bacterium]
MKNIIIFGAPGSGKGTYSDEIVKRYGMSHISTGDVLRGEIKNGTELGKIAQGYIDKGQLIPDELMINILAKVYDAQPQGKGVIFDGFPRTIAQAEALKKMLAERGHDMGMMVELIVEEDVLMARLLNRAIEQGRADDNETTIKARFDVYHKQTAPLAEWFEKEGIRHSFLWCENPSKEAMLEAIFKAIDAENELN